MKRKLFSILFALVLVLSFTLMRAAEEVKADPGTFTFPGGSLTTTNLNSWDGYNIHSYGVNFNVDDGPLTIEYLGVNAYPINYTGDFGWPPDPTDTGASVIVGVGNGTNIAQYSFKSNMSGNKPRGTDPETYGKGSWDQQNIGHWNDDGYRSYLFQGQFTDNWTATVGNSQYNAEKHGGPSGADPDYDTFDFKFYVEQTAPNTYEVTGWHNLWKSSAIDEGCYWDWNYAKNAHDQAKRGYLQCFEGTWTADGGLDLSDVQVFLAIQNWQGTQPELHSFNWDSVVVTGTVIPPNEVWVDDDWIGLNPGDPADGHTFGYDAFATIQAGIDAVASGGMVNVAAGTYNENILVNKEVTIQAKEGDIPIVDGGAIGSCFNIYNGGGLDNVTIDGFEIRNAVRGIWIYGSPSSYNDITISNNDIHTHNDNGILVTDAEISNLIISDNIIERSGIGISFANNAIVYGLTVEGNVIKDNNAGLSLIWGIFSDVKVNNCSFDGNAWEHIDLGCWGNNPQISNVNISECEFLSGPWCGIYIQSNFDNVIINYNNFLTGAWGVFNATDSQVDATNNWWGHASGPSGVFDKHHKRVNTNNATFGQGNAVSENVDYHPWLKKPVD